MQHNRFPCYGITEELHAWVLERVCERKGCFGRVMKITKNNKNRYPFGVSYVLVDTNGLPVLFDLLRILCNRI